MQAVVPAAGQGTRLRPLTDDRPKGLVDVAGEPLLSHCFRSLATLGVDEIIVVIGYRGDDIVDHYGDSFAGVSLTYAEQAERLGLGHAVLQAEPYVTGDFVVMNGDNVFDADLDALLDRFRATECAATVLVEDVSREEAKTTGVVTTDDAGRVTSVVEKPADPRSTLALTGCFAFSPAIFTALELIRPSDRGEYELSDALDVLCCAGHEVQSVPLDGWRLNVNTPDDLERATSRLD
jgi:glucose-1-phosphate thymidylyltransferase